MVENTGDRRSTRECRKSRVVSQARKLDVFSAKTFSVVTFMRCRSIIHLLAARLPMNPTRQIPVENRYSWRSPMALICSKLTMCIQMFSQGKIPAYIISRVCLTTHKIRKHKRTPYTQWECASFGVITRKCDSINWKLSLEPIMSGQINWSSA